MFCNSVGEFVFVMFVYHCGQINAVLNLDEYVVEACYGVTFDDYLQPNCNATDVLYIRDVYTFAKPISWNCPQLSTALNRNDQLCCRYMNDSVDCGWRYYGDTLSTHYTNCVGRQTCQVPVAWNGTDQNCNQTYFMEKTNYMREYYHCISSSSISEICRASTKTGNLLYIWNDGYPSTGSDCSTSSGCLCSISASSNSKIQIGILDIRFQSGSSCQQSLHITDGLTHYDIDCNHKNEFSFSTVYTSQSSSISIRFDNTHATNGGHFWISVQAVDTSSTLTMTCGGGSAVYNCGDVITTTTASSTLSSTLSSTSSSSKPDTTATTIMTSAISTESSTVSTSPSSKPTNTGTTTTMSSSSTKYTSTFSSSVTTETMSSSTTSTESSSAISTISANASSTEKLGGSADSLSDDNKTMVVAGAVGGAALLSAAAVGAGVMRNRLKRRNKIISNEEYGEHFGTMEDVPRNVAPIGYNRLT